jgi:heat shock protein HslJ
LLEGTEWRLVKLDDTSTFPTGNARQAHLMFRPEGTLTGADGCNSLRGSYKADGAALTIGPVMGTLMACSGLERRFLEALGATKKWKVSGNELTLLDGSDRPVATFEGWQP